jgi:Tfp pilus assembly protein PilF
MKPDDASVTVTRSGVRRAGRIVAPAQAAALTVISALLLAGCPGRGGGAGGAGSSADTRDPQKYAKMVTAFYTGVVALNVNDLERARTNLETATQLYPDEPAAWADLALCYLRTPNQLEPAAKALERARKLAPNDPDIHLNSALLADMQGKADEAAQHVRKALELNPRNVQAHALLAQQLERLAAPGSAQEIERHFEQILEIQPDNLYVLLELTRRSARDGDREKLRKHLDELTAMSGTWPPDPLQRLRSLRSRAVSAEPRSLAIDTQVLGNVLKQTTQYRLSAAVMGIGDKTQVGAPIERFLTLRQPPSTPAPRDEALAFNPEPVAEVKAPWAVGRVLAPAIPPTPAPGAAPDAPLAPAGPDEPPVVVYPSAGKLVLGPQASVASPIAPAVPEAMLTLDWNDDYRPDLLLAGGGGLRLYQQGAGGKWADVTAKSRLPAPVTGGAYTGAWAADFDVEGDLDAILGAPAGEPLALRNNGDGTWATARPFPGVKGLRDFVWADLDGDGDPDASLLDGASSLVVFLNERGGHFRKLDLGGVGGQAVALSAADCDQDGKLDLTVVRPGGAIQSLSLDEDAKGKTSDLAQWAGAPAKGGARLLWGDLDNNGASDLVASGPEGTHVWLRDEKWALQPLASPQDARVSSLEDMNGDGRVDLVGISKDGKPVRLLNQGSKNYHWQVVRQRNAYVREGDQKINSFGVGGEMEARAGMLFQKQPITGTRVHFGLGENAAASVVRIIWPNGQPQGEFDLAADQSLLANQRLTGSCPWLFAHDGEGMKFVTDALWKSPLGLRINAQDTAGVSQTRDWVRVRGSQLAARDGFYDLRITAELWETDFFDYATLMAVDHPEGTELLLDERFSIPQPELKLHITTPPVPVVRAVDQAGTDVTDVVSKVDGRYLDTFAIGRYQGVATDHWVEVTLPDEAARSGQLTLAATGWVYPTDSSINVAISQGAQEKPQALSIELPDGKGGWKVARAGLGFPAGKYKTVLLDLAGLFPQGQTAGRKLRLRTNMEIYWDALAVVSPAAGAGMLKREIFPSTAELRYRGFSRIRRDRRSMPETPEYDRLAGTGQQWLDLVGFYTRFGDVRELLTKVDDRYVIMNAGDELVLRFPALAPPRQGWTRDFVFVSDGWDKDGNYNTSYSTTLLPLPSHSRPAYDAAPVPLEQDPVYRRNPGDWQKYHTRYVSLDGFRNALRPRAVPPAAPVVSRQP